MQKWIGTHKIFAWKLRGKLKLDGDTQYLIFTFVKKLASY